MRTLVLILAVLAVARPIGAEDRPFALSLPPDCELGDAFEIGNCPDNEQIVFRREENSFRLLYRFESSYWNGPNTRAELRQYAHAMSLVIIIGDRAFAVPWNNGEERFHIALSGMQRAALVDAFEALAPCGAQPAQRDDVLDGVWFVVYQRVAGADGLSDCGYSVSNPAGDALYIFDNIIKSYLPAR